PEWSKYVTNVHLSNNLRKDHYDALFDPLQQYEVNVNASREKQAAKTHDPLALVAKTYRNTRNSNNVQRIPRTTANSGNGPNVQCYNCNAKDKVGIILEVEYNDFLLAYASEVEELKELCASVCMMAQIQQADCDSNKGPVYDSDFISEVSDPSMSFISELYSVNDHEQKYHEQLEIIKPTIGDDQINSDIIFDDPKVEAEKERMISEEVKQRNALLTKELKKYKGRVREFKSKNENKTDFQKEYIEATRREKKLDQQMRTQFRQDKGKIKIHPKNVEVHFRQHKKTNVTSHLNVVKTKDHVVNVNVENDLKANVDVMCVSCDKNVLTLCHLANVNVENALKANVDAMCVSYDKNVLTPCHDRCLARYKLSVNLKVRRDLFTTLNVVKSKFLDTTSLVVKLRFAVGTPLNVKDKDSSVSLTTSLFKQVIQIILWIIDSGCSKHTTSNIKLLNTSLRSLWEQSVQPWTQSFLSRIAIIMEYLVKINLKTRILELKRRNMKKLILTSNTSYPPRKIQRICACTSLKTTKEQDSVRSIEEPLYAVSKDIEHSFLSQKRSEGGRGVKEKDLNRNKKNTSSGIGVSTDSEDTMNDNTPVEYFPPLSTLVTTTAGNALGKSLYANITGKPSGKKVNVHTLFTLGGNGIDVIVLVDSIRAISERFANITYGFFVGKKVAYPVVANYVRNTWGKYGLVRSMFSSSTRLFSFQFSSIDGLDAMLENGSWFIRKKWHPNKNLLKEDVSTVLVWVKLHGVPVTAFSEDGLSAIATKLGVGEKKIVKKPSQTSRGIPVGPKMGFKHHKEYRPVPKKATANSSSNKKKGAEPTIKGTTNLVINGATSSRSSFMNVDNSSSGTTPIIEKIKKFGDLLTSGQAILVDKAGNPLKKVEFPGEYESKDEVASVDNDMARSMAYERVGFGTQSLLEQWRDSYGNGAYDDDPYNDDMYEGQDLSHEL
ncbi:retrovirus-related pol polyprotein from transposon TNT 1-94, partial [Tanacetum coccineum]